jgi:hypothetical protein
MGVLRKPEDGQLTARNPVAGQVRRRGGRPYGVGRANPMNVWGEWKKRWLRCGWFAVTWDLVRVQAAGAVKRWI